MTTPTLFEIECALISGASMAKGSQRGQVYSWLMFGKELDTGLRNLKVIFDRFDRE